ncbi:hypothetical protein chiPu_0030100, partial [Chiloscyllium punctatum]|nr:hypothetical protein [Chiloscyllium punctatum]
MVLSHAPSGARASAPRPRDDHMGTELRPRVES